MKLHRTFVATPFFMATPDKTIFQTPLDPREDNEFRAQVVVELSDQLALPFSPLVDAKSLNVTVTITYNREDVYTKSISVAVDDGPFWLQPESLLRNGPDILIRQVILPEVCVAWNQRGDESVFEKYDDEFFEWLRFLALVVQQDEIAETLFSGGYWDTCKPRLTQAGYCRSGKNEVDDTAPFILRVTDGTTCEAEMCGNIDDLLSGSAFYAKQYGTDSSILHEVAGRVPTTIKGHNGYRFAERNGTRSRDYDLDKLLGLLGIDDDRWAYSDETEVCFECNGIIDMDYGNVRKDQATFVDDQGYLCACCCEKELPTIDADDDEDTIFECLPDWLKQNIYDAQSMARTGTVPEFCLDHLKAAGFVRYGDNFEHGMHPGQNDTPEQIAEAIAKEFGPSWVAFCVTNIGQFDITFQAFHRVMGDFNPELEGVLNEETLDIAHDALIDNINATRND